MQWKIISGLLSRGVKVSDGKLKNNFLFIDFRERERGGGREREKERERKRERNIN